MMRKSIQQNQRSPFLFHPFLFLFKTWSLRYPQFYLAPEWHRWISYYFLWNWWSYPWILTSWFFAQSLHSHSDWPRTKQALEKKTKIWESLLGVMTRTRQLNQSSAAAVSQQGVFLPPECWTAFLCKPARAHDIRLVQHTCSHYTSNTAPS